MDIYSAFYKMLLLFQTPNCSGDKLRISLSGNPNFSDSNNYCGVGSVTLITKANTMALGKYTYHGAYFLGTCQSGYTGYQNFVFSSAYCDINQF